MLFKRKIFLIKSRWGQTRGDVKVTWELQSLTRPHRNNISKAVPGSSALSAGHPHYPQTLGITSCCPYVVPMSSLSSPDTWGWAQFVPIWFPLCTDCTQVVLKSSLSSSQILRMTSGHPHVIPISSRFHPNCPRPLGMTFMNIRYWNFHQVILWYKVIHWIYLLKTYLMKLLIISQTSKSRTARLWRFIKKELDIMRFRHNEVIMMIIIRSQNVCEICFWDLRWC